MRRSLLLVGTDFYSRFPAFAKLQRFYAQYPNGPFRLNSHPKARAEIRKALRNPRFLASLD